MGVSEVRKEAQNRRSHPQALPAPSVWAHLAAKFVEHLGAALSVFVAVCSPSPSITGPTLNLARPGLGFVFVLITVYIISSQHVEVIESCSSKLPISSSH